ncbi:hypothetical protein CsSME_00041448 [Camellia sinensis var. sinensis]
MYAEARRHTRGLSPHRSPPPIRRYGPVPAIL